jgi:hypothetical protein
MVAYANVPSPPAASCWISYSQIHFATTWFWNFDEGHEQNIATSIYNSLVMSRLTVWHARTTFTFHVLPSIDELWALNLCGAANWHNDVAYHNIGSRGGSSPPAAAPRHHWQRGRQRGREAGRQGAICQFSPLCQISSWNVSPAPSGIRCWWGGTSKEESIKTDFRGISQKRSRIHCLKTDESLTRALSQSKECDFKMTVFWDWRFIGNAAGVCHLFEKKGKLGKRVHH